MHPGRLLLGRYRIGERVGRGGMGEVYEGLHRATGRRVAFGISRSITYFCIESVERTAPCDHKRRRGALPVQMRWWLPLLVLLLGCPMPKPGTDRIRLDGAVADVAIAMDVGTPTHPDAAADGGLDGGTDAGSDAGADAAPADGGADAGADDSGLDAGPADGGADASANDSGVDAGPPDAGGCPVATFDTARFGAACFGD